MIDYLQRATLSGRELSLFPETFKTFRLINNPMESGKDFKRLDETLSSSNFCSPAIESGMICFPYTSIIANEEQLRETKP